MGRIVLLILAIFCYILFPSLVFADSSPTPTPAPQVQYSNEFTVSNEPSSVITLLQTFIQGFDSVLGGFIFYTPNPLASQITLKDGSVIPGVTKYRDMFYEIGIPILAIVIAGIAITRIGSDNMAQLKSFGIRLLIVTVLFLTVPSVLSYSIQFNNLLVNKISSTQQFTSFLDNYLTQSQQQIQNGAPSDSFGIPSFDLSLADGVFKSVGKFLVQILLFAITFLLLLFGFLYIGFQFVIRFAALLFLGVIYPIVIPFALSAKTEGIVQTFFKSWLTFLIQQPAFVLGFAIATDIFSAILNAKGPSVGLLFFYTGFLFFLAGVNVLVAKIFGDAWIAVSTEFTAAAASRSLSQPIQSSFNDFKKGFLGANSISYVFGQKARYGLNKLAHKDDNNDDDKGSDLLASNPDEERFGKSDKSLSNGHADNTSNGKNMRGHTYDDSLPPLSQALNKKGLTVDTINPKQGVVSVSGDMYRYDDKKTGLTTYYPTTIEAIQDGMSEDRLHKVSLTGDQFIDLSSFGKTNPNPHNFNAMKESQKQGKNLNYAYITEASTPERVKHFLDMSASRNQTYGIKGVIVQRQAKKGEGQIVRIYSQKGNEKR